MAAIGSEVFGAVAFAVGAGIGSPVATARARAYKGSVRQGFNSYPDTATATAEAFIPLVVLDTSITAVLASATALAFIPFTSRAVTHPIVKDMFVSAPIHTNHVYVIGVDINKNQVYGETTESGTLYGSVLFTIAEAMIYTTDMANAVAVNYKGKIRLTHDRGEMLISPNWGIQLWDVIAVHNIPSNQNIGLYRVVGWTLLYDRRVRKLTMSVRLTGV